MSRAPRARTAVPRLPARARIAAAVSTYHHEITGAMLASAQSTLAEAGLDLAADFFEVRVPGAFELPIVADRLAERDDVDAVLCFALLLKGETDHDRLLAECVTHALQRVALETRTPVLFGVLTCATLEQAQARALRVGAGGLDKGREVALAAIEVLRALERADADGFTPWEEER